MTTFNKSFTDIQFGDIQQLVAVGTSESQGLEYKREVWGKNEKGHDEGVREMLRDVSAMANAYGGYIILGMEENRETGAAKEVITIEDAESERDRIFSSCLANIQPRLAGLNIKCLTGDGKNILLLYVPHSLRAPHLVSFQGKNEFWIRHDRQKSRMSVEEIRDAFIRSTSTAETAKEFLANRRRDLLEEAKGKPTLALGAFPIDLQGDVVDTKDAALREKLQHAPKSRRGGWNFDFTYAKATPTINGLGINMEDWASIELYRNGYLEGVVPLQKRTINDVDLDKKRVRAFTTYGIIEYPYSFFQQVQQIMGHINYEGQLLVFMNLYNVGGVHLRKYREEEPFPEASNWTKNHLELGPMVFEAPDADKITKVLCDRLWQAYGFEQEPLFQNDTLNIK